MIFIRGIAIANSVERILKVHGKEIYIRIVEKLEKEDQEIFFNKIVAADLYPISSFIRFLKEEIQQLYSGDITQLQKNSKEIFEKQLRGVFQLFIRSGSPVFVINEISKITQAYFEGVTLEPIIIGNGRFIGQLKGFTKEHEILEYLILSFFETALEISGAQNVKARFSIPMSDHLDYSEITVVWGVQIIL